MNLFYCAGGVNFGGAGAFLVPWLVRGIDVIVMIWLRLRFCARGGCCIGFGFMDCFIV